MNAHFFYTVLTPILNTFGAAYSAWRNIRAARRGLPRDAPLSMAIAGVSIFYIFAYSVLWTGIVEDRAHWSELLAMVGVIVWPMAWAMPADRRVKNYEDLKASLLEHREELECEAKDLKDAIHEENEGN